MASALRLPPFAPQRFHRQLAIKRFVGAPPPTMGPGGFLREEQWRQDPADTTPIESRDQLAAYLESSCEPREKWRIGTEHEKFSFLKDGHGPVSRRGRKAIRALLEGMQALLGWEPINDGEDISIGLVDPIGGAAISLEPGGQLELLHQHRSKSIHDTYHEVRSHLAQVRQIANHSASASSGSA